MDAEQQFRAYAEAEGWTVTKRGWPDFICRRNGEFMAVEVKGPKDGLSREQWDTLGDLRRGGIPAYVWNPDTGLTNVAVTVGESVHSLRETIAELRTLIERLTSGEPEQEPLIRWQPDLHSIDGLRHVARQCRQSHASHRRYKHDDSPFAFCGWLLQNSDQMTNEQIEADMGFTKNRSYLRLIAQMRSLSFRWQHEGLHHSIGDPRRRCTFCELSEVA